MLLIIQYCNRRESKLSDDILNKKFSQIIKNRKLTNKFDNESILILTIFNFDDKLTIFNFYNNLTIFDFCEIRIRDFDFRDDFDIHNMTIISLTIYC